MAKYYSVAVREEGSWSVQFGDYDLETVKQEREDMLESCSWPDLKRRDTKIIRTGDSQADIEAELAMLNLAETR